MEEDTVVRLPRPGASVADDPLLEVLRSGARRMLQQVIEAEVEAFLAAPAELEDAHGRRRVVRPVGFADITPWDRAEPDGHAPEREIQTGIGPIAVRRPKLRDRGDSVNSARIRFTSKVLPPFLRRTRNVEELLPSGLGPIPRRDVSKADRALPQGRVDRPVRGGADGALGPRRTRALGLDRAPPRRGLLTAGPPDMDRRLCWPPMVATWQQDHERWQRRDRSARRYVYVWADGVYFTPRLEHERQCILVLIGADASGRKELLAIEDGFRESAQSWKELLLRLRDENGLVLGPELATGDGALGFWQALHQVWPSTRQQRCWVHKTANVLNALPKSLHGKAKQDLHAIDEAENRKEAELAFDRFAATYGTKYDKAVDCLAKDRAAMLAFYDFPAEHGKHVRSSNPIESTFATVRLRTDKTKGCLSRETALALSAAPTSRRGIGRRPMVFKLAKSAERHWRRLDGTNRLGQLIGGVRFRDGEAVQTAEEQAAA